MQYFLPSTFYLGTYIFCHSPECLSTVCTGIVSLSPPLSVCSSVNFFYCGENHWRTEPNICHDLLLTLVLFVLEVMEQIYTLCWYGVLTQVAIHRSLIPI